MYGHRKPNDPECVKIRTGFIITFDDCPVLWISKLQTETALYTMEADAIDIDNCCLELFHIINITQSLVKVVGLPVGVPSMKVSAHEYNAGALILTMTLPPKFTPHNKYYATKTIWFCEEINKSKILLLKIATVDQLGYLFTKGLPRATFE